MMSNFQKYSEDNNLEANPEGLYGARDARANKRRADSDSDMDTSSDEEPCPKRYASDSDVSVKKLSRGIQMINPSSSAITAPVASASVAPPTASVAYTNSAGSYAADSSTSTNYINNTNKSRLLPYHRGPASKNKDMVKVNAPKAYAKWFNVARYIVLEFRENGNFDDAIVAKCDKYIKANDLKLTGLASACEEYIDRIKKEYDDANGLDRTELERNQEDINKEIERLNEKLNSINKKIAEQNNKAVAIRGKLESFMAKDDIDDLVTVSNFYQDRKIKISA